MDDLIPEVQQKYFISRALKYCLLGFSLFFWIVGALFAAIGGWTISQKTGYEELSDFATDPGAILASLGCLIFIVSSFGVLGALRENICFLRLYKVFLVATLVFEFCAGLIGFAFWPEVKKIIQTNMSIAIEKYTVNPDLRNMVDLLQRELECCGSLTIDDWDSNEYFSCKNVAGYRHCGVPWSCCLRKFERNRQCGYGLRKTRSHLKLENEIHTQGCLDKGFEFFKYNMIMIAGLAIAFTFPLIAGIFMTHRFVKQIRKQMESVDPTMYAQMREEQTVECCMGAR